MCARRERGAPSPRGRRLLCPRPWGLAGLPSSSGRAPVAPVTPAAPSHLRRATNWTARSCSPELRAVLARGRSREVGCGALICSQAGQKDG